MTSMIKATPLLLLASVWLFGCASAPKLGKADTSGFHGENATVLVEYILPADEELTPDEFAKLHSERRREINEMLQGYGFIPVTNGAASFRINVTESAAEDVTGDWAGALGANAVIFTLGVVPAIFTYRSRMQYELWQGQERIHTIDTPAQWDEAMGLVSLSSTLSGADAAKYKARIEAHDSVISLWIEQGSFE